ncbi:PEP-CTERM sorting domain-containing protein [Aquabacterium fontiphilum]|uniref:PEP-CTERM sorting domain-containing protein n=1 Tax=Aquabacterium fontiphilum TaxID=450365 RepID=UPI0013787DD3|nr:PEP-CTERM sorting domain-containing protein [Aquabacterium fontiphilum]NBD20252.1 PEP-CTERM sorting domain-containing protein [Aquabacterium fontiphilum]
MNSRSFVAICLASLGWLSAAPQAFAATQLYYTSSADSWVGAGETVLVGRDSGFDITVDRYTDNTIAFRINDYESNPDFWSRSWWYLEFAAPAEAELTVGSYDHATRWPFQSSDAPGLSFSGNGRGNNTLTGSFTVLEAVYGTDGRVLSFAADFLQYDEGVPSAWNMGAIRYNSSIPIAAIPEPGALVLMGLGLLGLAGAAGRNKAG